MLEIPLEDSDRQSVIVRLESVDVKVRVYYQPVTKDWYCDIEAPNGTSVVRGRRINVDTSFIESLASPLSGDIWCRMIGDFEVVDPGRNPWGENGTHRITYEI